VESSASRNYGRLRNVPRLLMEMSLPWRRRIFEVTKYDCKTHLYKYRVSVAVL